MFRANLVLMAATKVKASSLLDIAPVPSSSTSSSWLSPKLFHKNYFVPSLPSLWTECILFPASQCLLGRIFFFPPKVSGWGEVIKNFWKDENYHSWCLACKIFKILMVWSFPCQINIYYLCHLFSLNIMCSSKYTPLSYNGHAQGGGGGGRCTLLLNVQALGPPVPPMPVFATAAGRIGACGRWAAPEVYSSQLPWVAGQG